MEFNFDSNTKSWIGASKPSNMTDAMQELMHQVQYAEEMRAPFLEDLRTRVRQAASNVDLPEDVTQSIIEELEDSFEAALRERNSNLSDLMAIFTTWDPLFESTYANICARMRTRMERGIAGLFRRLPRSQWILLTPGIAPLPQQPAGNLHNSWANAQNRSIMGVCRSIGAGFMRLVRR